MNYNISALLAVIIVLSVLSNAYIPKLEILSDYSDKSQIILYCGSKSPKTVIAEKDNFVESAVFNLDARAEYFRISVIDSKGKIASSRGFFRNE